MEIILKKPTIEYAKDIIKFRKEIFEAKDEYAFAGCGLLENCNTANEWIQCVNMLEKEETCPRGFVPSNCFLAEREL